MGGGCEWFKKVCMKKPSFNYKIRRELFTRKKKVSKTHIQDKTERGKEVKMTSHPFILFACILI